MAGRPSRSRRPPEEGWERVQRALARAGVASRRKSEELIRAGRVRVDGRVVSLGDRVDPLESTVTVDGVAIPVHPDLRHFALNKPRGVTTTLRDRHASRPLSDLLPPGPRVFPVGRLDRESEGLLLLTNDGELAQRIQHPRYGIEKEYLVGVGGNVPRSALRALVRGVELEDGTARAVRARLDQQAAGRAAMSIVLREGRKREVRRMLAALGLSVEQLVRVRVGPVLLGPLAPGRTRRLSTAEVKALYEAVGLDRATLRLPRGARGRRTSSG